MGLLVNARKGNLTLQGGYIFALHSVMTKWTAQSQRPMDPARPDDGYEVVVEPHQATDVTFAMVESQGKRDSFTAEDIIARHTIRVADKVDPIAAAYAELAAWRGPFGEGWMLTDQKSA